MASKDETQATDEPKTVEISEATLKQLLDALANTQQHPESVEVTTSPTSVNIGPSGQTQGVINKYPIEPEYYPNPLDFLYGLPQLERFGLRTNYELTWKVEGTQYETKWGTFIVEPRFTLTLYRRAFDEDNNLITGKRYLVKRGIFTEDEVLAKTLASELGIDVEKVDLRGLLNQVRMKRFQQWLEGCFKTRKSLINAKTTKKEVIGGTAYVVEEYEEEV